jgi:hypothetical protein
MFNRAARVTYSHTRGFEFSFPTGASGYHVVHRLLLFIHEPSEFSSLPTRSLFLGCITLRRVLARSSSLSACFCCCNPFCLSFHLCTHNLYLPYRGSACLLARSPCVSAHLHLPLSQRRRELLFASICLLFIDAFTLAFAFAFPSFVPSICVLFLSVWILCLLLVFSLSFSFVVFVFCLPLVKSDLLSICLHHESCFDSLCRGPSRFRRGAGDS